MPRGCAGFSHVAAAAAQSDGWAGEPVLSADAARAAHDLPGLELALFEEALQAAEAERTLALTALTDAVREREELSARLAELSRSETASTDASAAAELKHRVSELEALNSLLQSKLAVLTTSEAATGHASQQPAGEADSRGELEKLRAALASASAENKALSAELLTVEAEAEERLATLAAAAEAERAAIAAANTAAAREAEAQLAQVLADAEAERVALTAAHEAAAREAQEVLERTV